MSSRVFTTRSADGWPRDHRGALDQDVAEPVHIPSPGVGVFASFA
jgi:hypothetical protein